MRRYKIVPWVLLILSIINVTLANPVVSREIPRACADVMDLRGDPIPVSRSEKQNIELDKVLDKPSSAVHPRRGTVTAPSAPPESDYGSAPDSLHSVQTEVGIDEPQQASSEIEQLKEMASIESESHRTHDEVTSENYLASNEGGPGSRSSIWFMATPSTKSEYQESFLSKLVSNSKSFFSKLGSMSKNFFGKLAGKLKFWRRTSVSISA